ncbi:MAG: hypothetical protein KME49_27390 [Brasilonema octagenarum HA4186-MV1]|jgi:hypothetical protein|nr:hypothetical protein [Brasilonema octagenarum HA4186-MV1]
MSTKTISNNHLCELYELSDEELLAVVGGSNGTYNYKPRDYGDKKGLLHIGFIERNDQGFFCADIIGEDCDVEHYYNTPPKK